ncbi:MAG: ParB N-terminal domain-containing protein [Candidatus Caldarchaeum sp.]|nr:ParB N-terminal domain-containing protein [Candidatus Caldarchaeum sp.]MCS7133535.1 ParB N-terminal domain-containing protein [Candidatus Caldarchaeum sp.]MCX8201218.1 ParB N-terminal domain-containing protein [Candidatus Caldarchaeum sp.]MDW8063411.1 ParB N-terminal domain-containing protein [Candidatus Caldarchaeum sp.]MDW8435228.1 ParB N-terminal domain-containing protein [Candidatus Caldarchaeum sp.]
MNLKPWSLALAEVSWLKPHEQSIPDFVAKLAEEIRKDGRIIHPVIVDAGSGLVVDGTHRVEAAAKLGLPRIPVYAVEYFSPDIELGGWGRAASKAASLQSLMEMFKPLGFQLSDNQQHDYAAKFLWRDGTTKTIRVEDRSITIIYNKISQMERKLTPLGITYVREKDLERLVFSDVHPFGYLIRPLTKREIFETVLKGYRFPPKSTRHLVDKRPMFVFCPVEILYGPDAGEKFQEWLQGGTWVEIAPGVELDRKYDEKTRVFFREELKPLYPAKLYELVKASTS